MRAISRWDTGLPTEDRLRLAFRGIYQSVDLDRTRFDLGGTSAYFSSDTDAPVEDLASEVLPELERIAVFTDQPETAWATQTLPRGLFDVLPLSELPNRQRLQVTHFVVCDSTAALDENFLLSLWLDAEQDTAVVPEGAEVHDSQPEDGEFLSNCLYPMNGNQKQFHTRHAAKL